MGRHLVITEHRILKDVKLFRWVTGRQLRDYYQSGKGGRIKALEVLLPKLEKEGKLTVCRYKGEKVYSPVRKNKAIHFSLAHEVVCTEILIKLWRCRMEEGEIVPERAFRGFAIVPEWGIRYSEERGTMLVFEYSRQQNFSHGGVMKSKLTRYIKHLPEMQAAFQRDITVLFVIDVAWGRLADFLKRVTPLLNKPVHSEYSEKYFFPFYFINYEGFQNITGLGNHLRVKSYLWGYDGKVHSLEQDHA